MKCMNCGAEIPEGSLHCNVCGEEIQIVPDYNPLNDVLEAQVKDSIYDYHGMEDTYAARSREAGRRFRPSDDRGRGSRATVSMDTAGGQRRRAESRRRPKKRSRARKRKKIIIAAVVLILAVIAGVLIYQNSYAGQVKKGYSALKSEEYTKAENAFENAISKDTEKPDAYTGLSKVYIARENLSKAEGIFTNAIKEQPSNVDIYKAAIQFYTDTRQMAKITELLEACTNDGVLKSLESYISDEPKFSLEGGEYEEVQEVKLTTDGKTIYYTTDGTNPTDASTKYTEPIQISEGDTMIKAISVNKKGIPSIVVEQEYKVELPIEDAPKVSPSTGQYEQQMTIEITVPEGYTAYYTTDGTDPDASSRRYRGPIEMPKGNTIFCAVLVNDKGGRMSDITKRNYDLSL